MKGHLVALLTLVAAFSVFAAGSSAQSTCISTQTFWFTDHIPPGWTCGTGPGPFMLICTGASACQTTSWCPTCGKGGSAGGAPINFTNGNTYIQQNDVSLPGLGGGLKLDRTWSSMWPSSQGISPSGMFGLNWRSTYEEKVFSGNVGMQYALADGSFWVFGLSGHQRSRIIRLSRRCCLAKREIGGQAQPGLKRSACFSTSRKASAA